MSLLSAKKAKLARIYRRDRREGAYYVSQIKEECIRERLERLAEKDLPENVENRRIANEKYQQALKEHQEALNDLNEACKDMYDELYTIFSQLTTVEEIQDVVEKNAESLNELKLASAKLVEHKQQYRPFCTYNYYDQLFIELANKVMPEFVLYMDVEKLKTPNIPFDKLSRKALKTVEEKITTEKPELLEDYYFFDRYGYLLPSSITKITTKETVDDYTTAEEKLTAHLKKFPENYRRMDQELKLQLVRMGKFSNLLSRNKQLIKYMGAKEIKWLAKDSPDTVGTALYFYPEQLARIADKYPDFFADPALSIRKIFLSGKQITINKQLTRLTRESYAEALKDYYDLFIELGIYFRLPKDLARRVDPTVMTEEEKVELLKDLKNDISIND